MGSALVHAPVLVLALVLVRVPALALVLVLEPVQASPGWAQLLRRHVPPAS